MNFTLFFIIIIICYILYLYVKYKYRQYKKETNATLYIKPTIKLGEQILQKYTTSNSVNIKIPSKKIELNIPVVEKKKQSVLLKPRVDTKQNRERNKVLALVAGKYFITDKNTLDYLGDRLQEIEVTRNTTDQNLLYSCKQLFPIEKDPLKKMLIGQYIAKKTDTNNDIYEIYDYILEVAEDIGNHPDIRMNAVDILLQSNNNKYKIPANKILESIRTIGDLRRNNEIITPMEDIQLQQGLINDAGLHKAQKLIEAKKDVPRTVFEDSQNVHNTAINESVLKLASELVKEHNPAPKIVEFDYNLIKDFTPEERLVVEKSLHRIMTDSSTFKYETNLYIIFQSLLKYISTLEEPLKSNVNKRLVEELQEMSGLCVTGHLTRLLNVVQGFDEVPNNLKMGISLDDEIYATMKNSFDKILADNEDLMDDMLTDDKKLVSERLQAESKTMISQISSSYPVDRKNDVHQGILKGLNKYLGKEFKSL